MSEPWRVVVIGVSGSGKSTIGSRLAAREGARFLEGDRFHPAANVEKMSAGNPLDDADRWPWLAALRAAMRSEERVVVACSALRRSYRDAIRAAGHVRFVHLVVGPEEARRRLSHRAHHFMGPEMVDSQFEAWEEPGPDETDVVSVSEVGGIDEVVADVVAALATVRPGAAAAPLLAEGGPARSIGSGELRSIVAELARTRIAEVGARRVLLVPPDATRPESRAGEITGYLFEVLSAAGVAVAVLPALGTHRPMSTQDVTRFFAGMVPPNRVLTHRWRDGVTTLGEFASAEVAALSAGALTEPVPVAVSEVLLDDWDLVVSVGQVVPHEVIGMANFTKNLMIGLGGTPTIDLSHFLGALCGMESVMGRARTPVRDLVDAAFDRFLAPRAEVLWILTVVEDTGGGTVLRGIFAGHGGTGGSGGAAYLAAAELSTRCNVEIVAEPLRRVACWLDPEEFRTTWLANKAVYRTRMAIADGGELIVLAPGVSRFGEDPAIDALIRRHGYRGTPAVLEAVEADPEMAANLGAAAHLIHGSSEGRFRIVYCTDPGSGGLSREELESVGYGWRPLQEELDRLAVRPGAGSGSRRDRDGDPFTFIANPALGLWRL